jgi:peptide/nickel transport system permease protein
VVGLLAKRLVAGVGVLMVLTAVVFFLRQLSPVDPARALVGAKASASVVAAERKKLGLDDPVVIQYFRYLGNVVRGDFGESAVTHNAIGTDLGHFLTATTELLTVAFVLAAVFALIFAVATVGRWRGSGVLRMVMVVMSALPVFLTAVLGIIVFYEWLHLLPATGQSSYANAPSGPTGFLLVDSLLAGRLGVTWDAVVHLLLPATCLAIAPAVAMGRVLRSSLQHAMRSDYVRTAKAKGQGELRVMLAHALRNSLGPVLAMGGVQIAAMFAATLVIEEVFAWPGLGQYAVEAIDIGDFSTIAAVTLCLGGLYVIANLIVDILQAAADPRIRI